MKPHIEEAWRALRLADRDIQAFNILKESPDAHLSIICFHAQQAVEKSLKAVLFTRLIEFRRTHNLADLASLLRQNGIGVPLTDEQLLRLNPFAVTFRYDDMDIALLTSAEAGKWVAVIRAWAETLVRAATEETDNSDA
jgi:HEPN domain-containing protein